MPTEELFGAYHFVTSEDGAKADSFAFREDDAAPAHIETYEVKWGTRISTEGSAHGAADARGLRSDGDLVQSVADDQGAQDGQIDVIAPSWKTTTAADLEEARLPRADDQGLAEGTADLGGDFIL